MPSIWELQSQTNPQQAGELLSFPRRMKHLRSGLERDVLTKAFKQPQHQRIYILFHSFPLLEIFFFRCTSDTRHTLQPHSQKPLARKVRSFERTGQTFPCAGTTACMTIQRDKSGDCWGLKTKLVSFLAGSLIYGTAVQVPGRRYKQEARSKPASLGQEQLRAPFSIKPFRPQFMLKHTKKWQPKDDNPE